MDMYLTLEAADTAAAIHGQIECAQYMQEVLKPRSRQALQNQMWQRHQRQMYGANDEPLAADARKVHFTEQPPYAFPV